MARKKGRRVDRSLIKKVGWEVLWYKAMLCPKTRTDGQLDHTCSSCDERGYIYSEPVAIKGIFHSDNRQEDFNMAGAWEMGTARFSYEAHRELGVQDKIIVLSHPVRDSLVIERGAGSSDVIRSPNAVELLAVRDEGATYNVGSDCSLVVDASGNSSIKWEEGSTSPAAGENYSIIFTLQPTWIAAEHPMYRAFGSRDRDFLPHAVLLKRYDVAING